MMMPLEETLHLYTYVLTHMVSNKWSKCIKSLVENGLKGLRLSSIGKGYSHYGKVLRYLWWGRCGLRVG